MKTLAEYEKEFGSGVIAKAEVLAAMDCLVHHLDSKDLVDLWELDAFSNDYNWDILDCDPGESACRTEDYIKLARDSSEWKFNTIVMTFGHIMKRAMFREEYVPGAFNVEDTK